jgi:hypothetical protein
VFDKYLFSGKSDDSSRKWQLRRLGTPRLPARCSKCGKAVGDGVLGRDWAMGRFSDLAPPVCFDALVEVVDTDGVYRLI